MEPTNGRGGMKQPLDFFGFLSGKVMEDLKEGFAGVFLFSILASCEWRFT
jgi:hypothetical protein